MVTLTVLGGVLVVMVVVDVEVDSFPEGVSEVDGVMEVLEEDEDEDEEDVTVGQSGAEKVVIESPLGATVESVVVRESVVV